MIITQDEKIKLLDYDGLFVPSMKGEKAREIGTPPYSWSQRTVDDLDEHIDDYSLLKILAKLKKNAICHTVFNKITDDDIELIKSFDTHLLDKEVSKIVAYRSNCRL